MQGRLSNVPLSERAAAHSADEGHSAAAAAVAPEGAAEGLQLGIGRHGGSVQGMSRCLRHSSCLYPVYAELHAAHKDSPWQIPILTALLF